MILLEEFQRVLQQSGGRLVGEGTTAELDIENKFFDYYEGRAGQ